MLAIIAVLYQLLTSDESLTTNASSVLYPKILWSFFDRPVSSFISKLLNITKEVTKADWSLRLLLPNNLSDYLNVSTFPPLWKIVNPQLQSDYVRVKLVQQYGGFWIDASTAITSLS